MTDHAGPSMGRSAYDEVPYPTLPYLWAHPERMLSVARLYGLQVSGGGAANVLDLGCGDGGHLLAVASAMPRATCVGLDSSTHALARGRELAAAAQLSNVELIEADLLDPGIDLEGFDVVIAHGLLSWVPDDVGDAALELISRALAPSGVAFVSYYAEPGWSLRAAARAIARRGAGRETDPTRRQEAALDALERARDLHVADDAYGRLLELELTRYRDRSPEALHHDELSERCVGFSLEDVGARAARHGLAFLAECDPHRWPHLRLGRPAARRLAEAAGPDPVARQQLADDASGIPFNRTLLVRDSASFEREPDPERAPELWASARTEAARRRTTRHPPFGPLPGSSRVQRPRPYR